MKIPQAQEMGYVLVTTRELNEFVISMCASHQGYLETVKAAAGLLNEMVTGKMKSVPLAKKIGIPIKKVAALYEQAKRDEHR